MPTVLRDCVSTPSTRCRGATCGATIYFVRNPSTGRMVPVHCNVEGGQRPSDTNDASQGDMFAGQASVYDGKGISHFLDCPDADQFSRGAR